MIAYNMLCLRYLMASMASTAITPGLQQQTVSFFLLMIAALYICNFRMPPRKYKSSIPLDCHKTTFDHQVTLRLDQRHRQVPADLNSILNTAAIWYLIIFLSIAAIIIVCVLVFYPPI